MLLLNKQETNTIYATATEGITISGTTLTGFTMTIESSMDNKVTEFSLIDISEYPSRYNNFEFDNSVLTSLNEGLYDYGIYWTADGEIEMVEIGILRIISEEEVIDTVTYDDNDDDEYFSYENR